MFALLQGTSNLLMLYNAVRRATERRVCATLLMLILLIAAAAGCRSLPGLGGSSSSVRPRSLRDVPSQKLAFRFDADIANVPDAVAGLSDASEKLAPIQSDFDVRRKEEALLRTVVSPDGNRALALYAPAGDAALGEFSIDLYSADGRFISNVFPKELSGAFALTVAWSPDGNQIAFIGRKALVTTAPTPMPPVGGVEPPLPGEDGAAPPAVPSTSVAPLIPSVPTFGTEQIYIGDRDGRNIRPLTRRDGLIYFQLAWSPDSTALAALACKEAEWSAREAENKVPAGRPRVITLDGRERLLDDNLAEASLVWSPDASKIATAFDTTVAIYDAIAISTPTSARIPLQDNLLTSSVAYDRDRLSNTETTTNSNTNGKAGNGNSSKSSNKSGSKSAAAATPAANTAASPSPSLSSAVPVSFQPIVRLHWLRPETLFVQTGFVRVYPNEAINNFMRWHMLRLSPQAALLSRLG